MKKEHNKEVSGSSIYPTFQTNEHEGGHIYYGERHHESVIHSQS